MFKFQLSIGFLLTKMVYKHKTTNMYGYNHLSKHYQI